MQPKTEERVTVNGKTFIYRVYGMSRILDSSTGKLRAPTADEQIFVDKLNAKMRQEAIEALKANINAA